MPAAMAGRTTFTYDQLCALNHDRPPARAVRKALFTHRLWAPASVRCAIRRRMNVNINTPPAAARRRHRSVRHRLQIGCLNVRSLGSKTTAVSELIVDRRMDVAVLSETWHRSPGDMLVRLTTPPGYTAVDAVRSSDPNYGGLVIALRADFAWSQVSLPAFHTFEHLAIRLSVDGSSLVVIAVYRRPPKPDQAFFDDLSTLLESVAMMRCSVVLGGDFNIHVENPSDPDTVRFLDVLSTFGLTQRVVDPTHERGGTLDLVITDSDVDDVPIVVDPPGAISDHGLVMVNMPVVPRRCPIAPRTVRGWKAVDRMALSQAFLDSPLGSVPSDNATAEQLFTQYDTVLSELTDRFAPVRTVYSRCRPLSPWFDSDCRALRRKCRRLEKRFRRSYAVADRQAWISALREKAALLESKRAAYWTQRLAADKGNPRLLWRSLSSIVCRGKDSGLMPPPVQHSADDFQRFFQAKVQAVRDSTAAAASFMPDVGPADDPSGTFVLGTWRAVSSGEVRKLVMESPAKSCSLDPMPTYVLRDCLDALLPFLTALINASLRDGHLPAPHKTAVVTPLLKKQSLDPQDVSNYRPVSNLSYVSKLVERAAVRQLVDYLESNGLMPRLQSAYRRHHSTETALLKVWSDILMAADNQQVTLLALLDLSAAFDCVDHDILLSRLHFVYGISGAVLSWIRSFLSNRTQRVSFGGGLSEVIALLFGVPQGSVIGPLLFLLYVAEVFNIIESCGLCGHFYADDTQVYICVPVSESASASARLAACIEHLEQWMKVNRLKLNTDKTQLIWLGTRQQIIKLTASHLQLAASSVPFDDTVRNLGVMLDSRLTMSAHTSAVCRSCFFQLRQLRTVKQSLTSDAVCTLVQAFVHSRLDYCNSLLAGVADVHLQRLQSVQNAAARLVSGTPRREHITPVLRELHWLRVSERIDFKIAVLVWKCIHGRAPAYLSDLCRPLAGIPGRRQLRSSSSSDLLVPRSRTATGQRAFAIYGPALWNRLPASLRSPELSLFTFRRNLKTHLMGGR